MARSGLSHLLPLGRLEGGGDKTVISRDREKAGQATAPPTSPEAAWTGEGLGSSYSHSEPILCMLRRCRNRATYVVVTAVVTWRTAQKDLWIPLRGWNHIPQRRSVTESEKDLLTLNTIEHFALYIFQNVFV